jgi:hypothetical protein
MLTIVSVERYYTVIWILRAMFSKIRNIWLKPMKPANSLSMHFERFQNGAGAMRP